LFNKENFFNTITATTSTIITAKWVQKVVWSKRTPTTKNKEECYEK
jgi:hypothetical protein